MNHVGTKMV